MLDNRNLTALDINGVVEAESKAAVIKEINIASEYYIIEKNAAIYYGDIMGDVPPGCASKSKLISRLNDYTSKSYRPGIITLYERECPKHFVGGKWQAMYFAEFIEFSTFKLIDIEFIGNKNRVQEFCNSVQNVNWFHQAVAVSSLKLLERLYDQNALQSRYARTIIDYINMERKLRIDIAKIVSRAAKNHNCHELKQEFESSIHDHLFKPLIERAKLNASNDEKRLYKKYCDLINRGLMDIRKSAIKEANLKMLSA